MAICEIGQRVITRQIGQPVIGNVEGFARAEPYCTHCYPDFDYEEWDRHYPEWRKGYLVFVGLDTPIRCDCCETETWILILPMDDVEIFDDSFCDNMGGSMLTRQEE